MKRIPFLHNYIIDEEFQYSYVLYSLLLLLFVVVSTFAVIIIWNNFRFYRGYLVSLPSSDQLLSWAQQNNVKTNSMEFVSQYIAQAKPYTFYQIIFSPILVIFVVNFFVIAFSSLYISYRISLPLRELKKALRKKIESGEPENPLALKDGELFHELSSLANLAFFLTRNPQVRKPSNPEDAANNTPLQN